MWRYNGNSLQKFTKNPFNGLPTNETFDVLEDKAGNIWIAHEDGISRWVESSQSFENYIPQGIILPNIVSFVHLTEDQNGRIWIAGSGEVFIFDPKTKQFSLSGWLEFAKKSGIITTELRNNTTHSIVKKSENEFWLLNVYGLFSVDTRTMKFTYHEHPYPKDYFAFYISAISPEGKLWISTYDQCMYSFDPNKSLWIHHPCPDSLGTTPNSYIKNIWNHNSDTLLVLAGDELYQYIPKLQKYISKQLIKGLDIELNSIIDIEFVENNLFISSLNPGFLHFYKSQNFIEKIRIPMPSEGKNNIYAPLTSEKYLIGDWAQSKIWLCDQKACIELKSATKTPLGELQMSFIDSKSNVYFSTSKCIYKINESQGTAIRLKGNNIQADNIEFRNFIEDNQGNVYVRERSNGIFKIDSGSGRLEKLNRIPGRGDFSALYFDSITSKIWLASEKDGLFIIDPINFKYKNYPFHEAGKIKTSYINDIKGDDLGNIYLLIRGRGLVRLQSSNMKVEYFGEEDGLLTDKVNFATVDKGGELWFTSDAGLMSIERQSKNIKTYEVYPGSEIFTHRIFSTDAGLVHNDFPGHYLKFNNKDLRTPKSRNALYLLAASSYEKSKAIATSFTLPYRNNQLSLRFGKLSLQSLDKPRLEFNLNNAGWQPLLNNETLNLYNLSSGNHSLIVRDMIQPSEVLTISLKVESPWWQKRSFFYTVLVLLPSVIYGFLFNQKKSLNKKMEAKNKLTKKMAQLEMSALRAQMNPHFIFNCLNSIHRFILVKDFESSSQYLTKFSKLIREVLEISKKELVSLDHELNVLCLYLDMEAIRFPEKFIYKIQKKDDINLSNIMIPPLLLQPIAENAIWHGFINDTDSKKNHLLLIEILQQSDKICIILDDNGKGRRELSKPDVNHSALHPSRGIALIKERLQLIEPINGMGAEIRIIDKIEESSAIPIGTRVELYIPKTDQ